MRHMTQDKFDKAMNELGPRSILEDAVNSLIWRCEQSRMTANAEYDFRRAEFLTAKIEKAKLLKLFFE